MRFIMTCLALVTGANAAFAAPDKPDPSLVKRGEYLVAVGNCDACHTNKIAGPDGLELDRAHRLAGHLQTIALPSAPSLPSDGPWQVVSVAANTAWHGPWGVSYGRNLTPDPETGLGDWTDANFIATMRHGRRLGKGRKLLPPMIGGAYAALSDDDLRAIFAFLRSLPPIKNKVPQPIAQ